MSKIQNANHFSQKLANKSGATKGPRKDRSLHRCLVPRCLGLTRFGLCLEHALEARKALAKKTAVSAEAK